MKKLSRTEFLALQKFWYQKLADSGFVDIEETRYKQDPLERVASGSTTASSLNKFSPTWVNSKKEYYELATRFLLEHKFETELERIIWEYHTNAISVRNITKLLNKLEFNASYVTLWRTVNKLRNEMKVKYSVNPPKR
jgi:hypothetical protein